MEQEGKRTIRCVPSAFKHGVDEEDIRSAFENKLFERIFDRDGEKTLLIGMDRRLNPLEILYNDIDGQRVNVFHVANKLAMKCRRSWRNIHKLEEKLWLD